MSEGVSAVQKAKTLLDIGVRSVLERVEAKYGVKLPRRVITIDYSSSRNYGHNSLLGFWLSD